MTTLNVDKYREMYEFLKEKNYKKVEGKSFEDVMRTIDDRQVLRKAYDGAVKSRKYKIDPEKIGFSQSVSEKEHKEFLKKLNSGLISKKSVARYEEALNKVSQNGGFNAPKELLSKLSKARTSANATYNTAIKRKKYTTLRDNLKEGSILESDLTKDQKKLFDQFSAIDKRRSAKTKKERSDRGLRGKGATLEGQKTRLNESFEAYTGRMAREGYTGWLKYNKDKGASAGLLEATPKQQASLWWDTLPESEKQNWAQELREPYDHNRAIIKKYHDAGELVPNNVAANELKQLHHIYPRSMGGGHFGSQISSVTGDAFSSRGSQHGLLHDPRLDQFYKRFEGQNWMPFDFNDPNIIDRASGSPKINKQGLSYLNSIVRKGFLPSLLGTATLPLWLMAPDKAQAMTDTGQENISSAANKYLPQGLVDYAKSIGSKVDNYIGQSIPTNTMGGMQANIGQMLYEGFKQAPSEIAGLIDFVGKNPEEYLNPEKNISFAERMRLMQSGRSY